MRFRTLISLIDLWMVPSSALAVPRSAITSLLPLVPTSAGYRVWCH